MQDYQHTVQERSLTGSMRKCQKQSDTHGASALVEGYLPVLKIWMLRLICQHKLAFNQSFRPGRFRLNTGSIFAAVSDTDCPDHLHEQYCRLFEKYQHTTKEASGPLANNLQLLCEQLSMSPVERDIIAMLVLYRIFGPFEEVVDMAFPRVDFALFAQQVAGITGHECTAVEHALQPAATLLGTGLLKINRRIAGMDLALVVELDSQILGLLVSSGFKAEHLLARAARPLPPGTLAMTDFDHMAEQRNLLVRYLRAVLKSAPNGANILFDGPPGTGKTEMARLVARKLNFEAWEVKALDGEGRLLSPSARLRALYLTMRMSERSTGSLIVVDEADAVAGNRPDGRYGRETEARAGILRMLEESRVPMLWITNHSESMDEAIKRRFSLVVRFTGLPTEKRESILRGMIPGCDHSNDNWIKYVSRHQAATPARLAQAGALATLISGGNEKEQPGLFKKILEQNLAISIRQEKGTNSSGAIPYRLDAINADEPLDRLVEAVRCNPQGRIALYGPPGSGKTCFARHLASCAGLQVAEYRASDIISRYAGETEQNISRMFKECAESGEMLFIDEADGLMASRGLARQRWELSQVNELIKGLEQFEGLFVASTNQMENVDAAIMRRLDMKIHFGWLEAEAKWSLFNELAQSLGIEVAESREIRSGLNRLEFLAFGDFSVIARRARLGAAPVDAAGLLDALERETQHKPEARQVRPIGFGARL